MHEHQKIIYIIALLVPLIIGGLGFISAGDTLTRILSSLFLCGGYVIWGLTTHYFADRPVSSRVAHEYVMMGLLGLALTIFLV